MIRRLLLARRYGSRQERLLPKKVREAGVKPPTPALDHAVGSRKTTLQTQEKNELVLAACLPVGQEKPGLKIRQKILERTKGDQYQQCSSCLGMSILFVH